MLDRGTVPRRDVTPWAGWEHPALPVGVLPVYSAPVVRARVRALYLRLVAERPATSGERRMRSVETDRLARGYERALPYAGLRLEGGRVLARCEACGRGVQGMALEVGQWRCWQCAQGPSSMLARAVGAYVFAVRVGLVGQALKECHRQALRAQEKAVNLRGVHLGSALDVDVATRLLARKKPSRVRGAPVMRDGLAFPWPRRYGMTPWRRWFGPVVLGVVCETRLHPASVKARLLETASSARLT